MAKDEIVTQRGVPSGDDHEEPRDWQKASNIPDQRVRSKVGHDTLADLISASSLQTK